MRPHCQNTTACQAKGAGHCRKCWGLRLRQISLDPDVEARRRIVVSDRMASIARANWENPVLRERWTERARTMNILGKPENRAKSLDPEARARLKATRAETVAAMPERERRQKFGRVSAKCKDLTPAQRDEYHRLRARHFSVDEAMEIIRNHAEAETRRARDAVQASLDAQRDRAAREKAQAY